MKKTNKILTNVLLGALTLSSLGLANVQAGEVNPTTNASVTIEDGIIEHTNNTTALMFDGPKFSFETYFGSSPSTTEATDGNKVELKVNDQRSLNGITDGWKVTAQLSSFTKKGDGKTLGEGTFISLLNGAPVKNSEFVSTIEPPIVEEDITLQSGAGPVNIWFADRGQEKANAVGVDKWTLNYEGSNIKLTIPNDELVEGSHSAIITWTFSNTFEDAPETDPVD